MSSVRAARRPVARRHGGTPITGRDERTPRGGPTATRAGPRRRRVERLARPPARAHHMRIGIGGRPTPSIRGSHHSSLARQWALSSGTSPRARPMAHDSAQSFVTQVCTSTGLQNSNLGVPING